MTDLENKRRGRGSQVETIRLQPKTPYVGRLWMGAVEKVSGGLPVSYLWRLLKHEQESRRNRGVPALHPATRESVRPLVRLLLLCERTQVVLSRLWRGGSGNGRT